MSTQPDAPQPNPQTVINVQKREIDRLNDNRVFLMSLLDDTREEAFAEIGKRDLEIARLNGVVSQMLGMMDEELAADARALLEAAPAEPPHQH